MISFWFIAGKNAVFLRWRVKTYPVPGVGEALKREIAGLDLGGPLVPTYISHCMWIARRLTRYRISGWPKPKSAMKQMAQPF